MSKASETPEEGTFSNEGMEVHPPSDIVAYNELRSCADLFRMHTQGILDIHPEFQRDLAWQPAAQTRFIDSLAKQLPIPSMCFSFDHEKQKWLVIDGLQRMSTIIRFLSPKEWKLSRIDEVDPKLAGASNIDLREAAPSRNPIYSRVENLTLPITVLRCNYTKPSHMNYLFMIFHRLNTGGIKLNNQEIRNCIYGGNFNDLLKHLDNEPDWRKLNKMKPGSSYRFAKQELILRFFAFNDRYKSYDGMLARFLNTYMFDHRQIDTEDAEAKAELFKETVNLLVNKGLPRSPVPKLSITLIEAALFATASNLRTLRTETKSVISRKFKTLSQSHLFTESKIREGLSKKPRVLERLTEARRIFRG